jgi:hypothetical protein
VLSSDGAYHRAFTVGTVSRQVRCARWVAAPNDSALKTAATSHAPGQQE